MALTVTHALIADGTPWVDAPDWNASHGVAGTLDVANGGTGLASYAIGDLLYASGTTALSKLADVAVGSVLVSGGVGTAPAWSANPTVASINTPVINNSGGGITVRASGVDQYYMQTAELIAASDAGADFGRPGTYRFGHVYAAIDFNVGNGAVVMRSNGVIDFLEIATPAAPSANSARTFARDNGSGKTQYCVLFPSGAVQVLSTEP